MILSDDVTFTVIALELAVPVRGTMRASLLLLMTYCPRLVTLLVSTKQQVET